MEDVLEAVCDIEDVPGHFMSAVEAEFEVDFSSVATFLSLRKLRSYFVVVSAPAEPDTGRGEERVIIVLEDVEATGCAQDSDCGGFELHFCYVFRITSLAPMLGFKLMALVILMAIVIYFMSLKRCQKV